MRSRLQGLNAQILNRRHRHRSAVDRGDCQQRRPGGLLHRRRRPAELLSASDRGRRLARRNDLPKPLRVHLGEPATGRQHPSHLGEYPLLVGREVDDAVRPGKLHSSRSQELGKRSCPSWTLGSTSSSPRSDRIGLFAAKTRGVADVRHRNNDVLRGRPRKCGTRGAAPATAVVNTRSNIQRSAFVLWHASSYPGCSRWPDVWLARMPRTGSSLGVKRRVPLAGAVLGESEYRPPRQGASGPDWARHCAPWRSGMARSRTTMRTHPTTTNGTRTLDAGVHHGEGRAGFWEPL